MTDISSDSEPVACEHEYRLYNDIRGEWKLIWECQKCGHLCICKCFKKAIEGMSSVEGKINFSEEHDIEALCRLKDISPEELMELIKDIPFEGMVCEICRDVPSTHIYSDDLEHLNEFQRRYGAYIVKQAIEMIINGQICNNGDEYLHNADKFLREMYGFRPQDETGIDDGKLLGIVKVLYPDDELIHHYRPDWLDGDDLEVFIPRLNLAIEYRGIEHYEVIDAAGGRSGLRDIQEQDIHKLEKCNENGIRMLVFPYFKELDMDSVKWRVAELFPSAQ